MKLAIAIILFLIGTIGGSWVIAYDIEMQEIDQNARADSLQELLWQCAECCSDINEERRLIQENHMRWLTRKDSIVSAMYQRLLDDSR